MRSAGLVLLAALTAGCADRIVYVPIVAPPRALAPRAPAQVDMFVLTPAARPHVDIGMLQVIRGANDDTLDQMVGILHVQAAARGCDAVVITMVDARASKHSPASVEGSCEVYTSPSSPRSAGAANW